jgi:pimeloyl-ACP methyl ester carboxylesterase
MTNSIFHIFLPKSPLLCWCFLFFLTLPNTCFSQDRSPLFKSFDGTQIHYEIVGQGKPVVLLHGFIVNSQMWKRGALIIELVNAGFQVVNVDLRGNGLSDKPYEDIAYKKDAEVKDIMLLMKHLGHEKYAAIGYSRGAILVGKLLAMDKNVKAAVMGGMGKGFTDPNWSRRRNFEQAFSGKAHLYPELQSAVNYAKTSGADTVVMRLLQKHQPTTSEKKLKKVKQPVLVICGEEDKDNGNPADLAKLFPNATLSIVKGNHNNTHATKEFAESIVNFLKKN